METKGYEIKHLQHLLVLKFFDSFQEGEGE